MDQPNRDFSEDVEPLENELDLEELLLEDLLSTTTQSTDWTVETILNQIQKGKIQLNPNFQRRDAWTPKRKSEFIESIILRFPIPQLVFAEFEGRYIVLDGKQRLLALMQFEELAVEKLATKQLELTGLRLLSQLNGDSKEEILADASKNRLLDDFENRTIRTIVIRNWKHESLLYHIFLRLNTGTVSLSPQELRNALHPGPFAEFVDKYSGESPALRTLLGTDEPDFRMRDAELLLRYFAFRNFLELYAGSMKRFLDETTRQFNEAWPERESELRSQADDFESAVNLVFEVFGDRQAFRKFKDGRYSGRFNRAVFDVMMYHFWRPDVASAVRANSEEVKQAFERLSEESPEFLSSVESTTKSLIATSTRLSLWTQALNEGAGLNLPIPRLEDNRIRVSG